MLSFIPTISGWFNNSRNIVAVEFSTEYKPLSLKNHVVKQDIILEGELLKISVLFDVPSTSYYENAEIIVNLNQDGNVVDSKIIKANDLASGLNALRLSASKGGRYTLSLYGQLFPEGTDLFLELSSDNISGLPGCSYDANVMEYPIVMNYEIMRHDSFYYYECCMIVALLLTIIGIAFLYAFKITENNEYILFCASFLLLLAYIMLRNPIAGIMNDPYSEAVYEFWYKAHTMGFWSNLMSLMSGESLAWTERILMFMADRLTGGGRYVFALAQILELFLICGVSSMICLPDFKKYLSDEVRFLAAFFLGGNLLFYEAYLFWAVSYWVSIFIILGFLIDLDKLKRPLFIAFITVTVVFSVSRIYHILFIPIAVIILLVERKTLTNREKFYALIVAVASLFECTYSLINGGSEHVTDGKLDMSKVAVNTIYYQLQVINRFLLGKSIDNALAANILSFIVFAAIIVYCVWLFGTKNYHNYLMIIALGIMSTGSVMINVVVSMMSSSVSFSNDYSAPVDFRKFFYQIPDLHFSYSYIALTFMLLFLLYFIGTVLSTKVDFSYICLAQVIVLAIFIMRFNVLNKYNAYTYRIIPTDWKNEYQVTKKDVYYLPVNASILTAHISLQKGTANYIYGVYDDSNPEKSLNLWNPGDPIYTTDVCYKEATVGSVSDIENRQIISVCARRASSNFANDYYIILSDKDGNVLYRGKQLSDPRKLWMDFQLATPVSNCYSIRFENEYGKELYIRDGLQIGFSL